MRFIPKSWAYRKCFDAYYYIFYIIRKKKCICIHIGSVGLYIYFGIRARVKFFEKKGCYIYFGIKAIVKLLEKKKGVTFYFGISAYV